jgi:cardiolipin synthase
MRSLYLNLEVVLRVEDAAFAAEARRYVEAEIADSRQITPEIHQREGSWLKRVTWALAYFVVVSMDYNVSRRLNFGIDGR